MGRSVSAASVGSLDVLYPPVGTSAVAINNLVVMEESGYVRPADPQRTIAEENSATAGPVAITAKTTATSASVLNPTTRTMCFTPNMARLSNGNLVMVFIEIHPKFCIMTHRDEVVVSNTQVTAAYATVNRVSVVALSTGGFVVLHGNGTTEGAIVGTVYDNNGVVVTATASLVTSAVFTNRTTSNTWYPIALGSGKFAIFYTDAAVALRFQVFNANGTTAVASTVVTGMTAGGAGYDLVTAKACAGGDMIFYHANYNGGGAGDTKIARYTAAGSIVGSVQTLVSYSNVYALSSCINYEQVIAELSNGSIAAVAPRAGGSYFDVAIVNAGFTSFSTVQLGANALLDLTVNDGHVPCLAASADGTWAALYGDINLQPNYLMVFSNAGSIVVPECNNFGTTVASGVLTMRSLIAVPYVGWAMFSAVFTTTANVYLSMVGLTGQQIGSLITLSSEQVGGNYSYPHTVFSPLGLLNVVWKESGYKFACYRLSRSGVIGVATASASAGAASVSVSNKGYYILSGQSFVPTAIDQRSANIIGPYGSIVGNQAILKGLT